MSREGNEAGHFTDFPAAAKLSMVNAAVEADGGKPLTDMMANP
jgi:hypothetical protein